MGFDTKKIGPWVIKLGYGRPYWIRAYQMFLFLIVLTWVVYGLLGLLLAGSEEFVEPAFELVKENQTIAYAISLGIFLVLSLIGIFNKDAHTFADYFKYGPMLILALIIMIPVIIFFTPIMMFGLCFKHIGDSIKAKEKGSILALPLVILIFAFIIFTMYVLTQLDNYF